MKDSKDRKVRGKRKELKYIIILPESPPGDICERISKIHASAILQGRYKGDDTQKKKSIEV